MKMYYGPRMKLVTNTRKEEGSSMLEAINAPPVINSFENHTEKFVADWYAEHPHELRTQAQVEGLQYFPAPPVLLWREKE